MDALTGILSILIGLFFAASNAKVLDLEYEKKLPNRAKRSADAVWTNTAGKAILLIVVMWVSMLLFSGQVDTDGIQSLLYVLMFSAVFGVGYGFLCAAAAYVGSFVGRRFAHAITALAGCGTIIALFLSTRF